MKQSNIIKFAGLIAFIVLMLVIMVVLWPYIIDLFSEGGIDRLVAMLQDAGPGGVFILLGMQFLQIVVAFIPGEVVQFAAGIMYGPFLGAFLILVGCVISSSFIYFLVHRLGAPFVHDMISQSHIERFKKIEQSKNLDVVVFILFLIPGLPKDAFTYLVPLTQMTYGRFIVLTTLGRIPGVLGSTYAASGFANGDFVVAIVVLSILAIVAIVALIFHQKIADFLSRR